MKTLTFVLLFLPLTALSQYPPSQALPDAYYLRDNLKRTDTTEGLYPITTLEPLVSKDELQYCVFIPRLLLDWKAYTEECDSTFIYNDGFEYERMTVTKYRETLAGWLSDTPLDSLGHWYSEQPTLPGFMLYLERKYQPKGVKP